MIEARKIDIAALAALGCCKLAGAISGPALANIVALAPSTAAGLRLSLKDNLLRAALPLIDPVAKEWRATAFAVRAVLFDKSPAVNGSVPWHQDRTLAVTAAHDAPGFGPWSVKEGVTHVEPPFEVLAAMLTVRIHLDDCPAENAPLIVALGSHHKRHAASAAAAAAAVLPHQVCVAVAGDVWAYSTPILHMSRRSERPERRRVLQIDYCSVQLPPPLRFAA